MILFKSMQLFTLTLAHQPDCFAARSRPLLLASTRPIGSHLRMDGLTLLYNKILYFTWNHKHVSSLIFPTGFILQNHLCTGQKHDRIRQNSVNIFLKLCTNSFDPLGSLEQTFATCDNCAHLPSPPGGTGYKTEFQCF